MREHKTRDAANHNKLFIGRLNKMKLEKDQIKRENDQMKLEKEQMKRENDQMKLEKDQMKRENDQMKLEKDQMETKHKEEIALLKARCNCQKL